MTPELKVALELVFQEHKTSAYPVAWNKDVFRGRISTALSELAKETLLKKNIIVYPNPNKRMNTTLNPKAFAAANVEEAEQLVVSRQPMLTSVDATVVAPTPMASNSVTDYINRHHVPHRLVTMGPQPQVISAPRWYMRPFFYYFLWPLCAAAVGALLAYSLGALYTEMAFDIKK